MMAERIYGILLGLGMKEGTADLLSVLLLIAAILLICVASNFITQKVILGILGHYIRKNKFRWDNIMLEKKVFRRLAHLVPALLVYGFANAFPEQKDFIQRVVIVIIYLIGLMVLDALLNSADDIYRICGPSKDRPIKGYIQVVKIVAYIIGSILIIASLIGQNPLLLLSGIGALSAVLMVIFKDTLLGFVAGVLISTNDMLRIGDWIEMPKYGADGDVLEVTLHTVKVENFDKTITTIPSYALISDSFRNWRGMVQAGGRRIKRSIYIDATSIGFCTEEMLAGFEKIHYLTEYLQTRRKEIEDYNREHGIDDAQPVNGRRMTNIGTFRAYVRNYLSNHPKIHKKTFLYEN
jgi:miniconductance mechanosensitive channel